MNQDDLFHWTSSKGTAIKLQAVYGRMEVNKHVQSTRVE